ncbi:MAG: hypothetical protein IJU62_00795 [Muribaculaceae bacterium]|nr:hypothetical protein [Muribaculaceae bacterium]
MNSEIKRLLTTGLILLGSLVTVAQMQHIYLKDGSVLNGHMSSQRIGQNIEITTSSATICIPDNGARVNERLEPIDKLSQQWIDWADENDAWQIREGKKHLTMADISFTTKDDERNWRTIESVRIIERGNMIKYHECRTNHYVLKPAEIDRFVVDRRSSQQLTGTNVRYTLRDGRSVTGQYIELILGKTRSIIDDNGIVYKFPVRDILKQEILPLHPDYTLLQQSEFLDEIELKSQSPLKGVISLYDDEKGYVTIESVHGGIQTVRMDDIVCYRKTLNKDWVDIEDILLEDGELLINRYTCDAQKLIERDNKIHFDVDSVLTCSVPIAEAENLLVETKIEANSLSSRDFVLLRLRDYTPDLKKEISAAAKNKKAKPITAIRRYGFTYEDAFRGATRPVSRMTTPSGTTRLSFKLVVPVRKAIYAIYDSGTNQIYPFIVD